MTPINKLKENIKSYVLSIVAEDFYCIPDFFLENCPKEELEEFAEKLAKEHTRHPLTLGAIKKKCCDFVVNYI